MKPVPAWILARLYDEETPLPRKTLLKTLCQASFDSMVGDNDFTNTMKELEKEHYIKFEKQNF